MDDSLQWFWYNNQKLEGWIDIQYPEPHTVDGLRYLPGPSLGGSFTSITTYEISVKTADSDEYQVVATGDWANTAGWKTADFTPGRECYKY